MRGHRLSRLHTVTDRIIIRVCANLTYMYAAQRSLMPNLVWLAVVEGTGIHHYTHQLWSCYPHFSNAAGCVKFTLPATGWEFKLGVDSAGYDLTNIGANGGDWTKLINGCDAVPGCKAINTGGW